MSTVRGLIAVQDAAVAESMHEERPVWHGATTAAFQAGCLSLAPRWAERVRLSVVPRQCALLRFVAFCI
jgi:hypothetical protein